MKPTPEHIAESWRLVNEYVVAGLEKYAANAIATALAAAEERGRMEERERCAQITKKVADDAAEDYPGETWIARMIIDAITKDPTP